jgi:hypothetical protein
MSYAYYRNNSHEPSTYQCLPELLPMQENCCAAPMKSQENLQLLLRGQNKILRTVRRLELLKRRPIAATDATNTAVPWHDDLDPATIQRRKTISYTKVKNHEHKLIMRPTTTTTSLSHLHLKYRFQKTRNIFRIMNGHLVFLDKNIS